MQKKHLTKLKIKTLNKLGIKGNYFNIVKTLCEKPTANIMLMWWKTENFSPKIKKKARMPNFTNSIQYSTGNFGKIS